MFAKVSTEALQQGAEEWYGGSRVAAIKGVYLLQVSANSVGEKLGRVPGFLPTQAHGSLRYEPMHYRIVKVGKVLRNYLASLVFYDSFNFSFLNLSCSTIVLIRFVLW